MVLGQQSVSHLGLLGTAVERGKLVQEICGVSQNLLFALLRNSAFTQHASLLLCSEITQPYGKAFLHLTAQNHGPH